MEDDIYSKLNQLRGYLQTYSKSGILDDASEKASTSHSNSCKTKSKAKCKDISNSELKNQAKPIEEKKSNTIASSSANNKKPEHTSQRAKSSSKKQINDSNNNRSRNQANKKPKSKRISKRNNNDSFYGVPANELSNTFQSFIGDKSKEEYVELLKLARVFRHWKRQLLLHLLHQMQNTIGRTETFDDVIESSQKSSKNSNEDKDSDEDFSKEKSVAFIKETDSSKNNSKEENGDQNGQNSHSKQAIPKSPNAGEYEERVNFISPEFRDSINKYYPEEEEIAERKKIPVQNEEENVIDQIQNELDQFIESDDFDINDSDLINNDDEINNNEQTNSNKDKLKNADNQQKDFKQVFQDMLNNDGNENDELSNDFLEEESNKITLTDQGDSDINISDDFVDSSEDVKKDKDADQNIDQVKLSQVVEVVGVDESKKDQDKTNSNHPAEEAEIILNIDSLESDDILQLKETISEESLNESDNNMQKNDYPNH